MKIRPLDLVLCLAAGIATVPADAAPVNDFSDLGGNKTVEQSLAYMNKQNDPCVYVEPTEAAALASAPLIAPPVRIGGGAPDASGTNCRYMISGFRSIDVFVAKSGGDKLFEILTGINTHIDMRMQTPGNLNKTLPLEGEWDEVRAFKGAGLAAIRGDTLVGVELRGIDAPKEKVAAFVNAIYRRLDKPLAIDGAAGVAAAQAIELKRPRSRDTCSLLTDADMQSSFGPGTGKGSGSGRDCLWNVTIDNQPRTFALNVMWKDGYGEFATLHTVLQGGAKSADQAAARVDPATAAMMRGFSQITELPPGPWDFAFSNEMGLTAVKQDVRIFVFAPGVPSKQVAALVGKVIARIETP